MRKTYNINETNLLVYLKSKLIKWEVDFAILIMFV